MIRKRFWICLETGSSTEGFPQKDRSGSREGHEMPLRRKNTFETLMNGRTVYLLDGSLRGYMFQGLIGWDGMKE
jgi:hypothetical protein